MLIFHDGKNLWKKIERKEITKSSKLYDHDGLQHQVREILSRSRLVLVLDGDDSKKKDQEGDNQKKQHKKAVYHKETRKMNFLCFFFLWVYSLFDFHGLFLIFFGVWTILEEIAWLTIKDFAELIKGLELDGLELAILENGNISHGQA